MFRHIVCHPQGELMVLAKITCKTSTLHSVKGVYLLVQQAHTEHTAHAATSFTLCNVHVLQVILARTMSAP
jgi:hypothetical protein